jgi:hypothetical protein
MYNQRMGTPIDMIGKAFGRLTVVRLSQRKCSSGRLWECACSCGGSTVTSTTKLRSGHTQSCGCLQVERFRAAIGDMHVKHGMSKNKNRIGAPEYTVWQGIKARCTNQKNKRWKDYGGRGIQMCDEWLNSFSAFFACVGKRPSMAHTIDRINNDGHYEPGNVTWATKSQQSKNRRPYKQPNRTLKNAMRRAAKATQQGISR